MDSPPEIPVSCLKYHQPYFTAEEIEFLSEKQRGKLTSRDETKLNENACTMLEAIGSRIGLYANMFIFGAKLTIVVLGEQLRLRRIFTTVFISFFRVKALSETYVIVNTSV
jgi:hypothetical protein